MATAAMAQASSSLVAAAASLPSIAGASSSQFPSTTRVHFNAKKSSVPALPQQLRRRSAVAVRAAVLDVEKLDRLVTEVEGLTLQEACLFTDKLQDRLGVSAASFAPAGAGAAGAGAPADAAPAVEEKTEFDLVLEDVPASARIAVIKVVRTLTALGLKEAKDMIEGLPKTVKEGVSKEDAEEAMKTLPKTVKEGVSKEDAEEAMKTLQGAGAKCSIK